DRPSASHGGGRNSNGPSKGRVGTVRENGAHAPGPEPANSPLPVRQSGRSLARGPMARNRQSGPIEPVHPVARVERRGWRGGGHEADHGHAPPQGALLFRLPARRAVDGPDASRRHEARRGGVRPVRSRERLRVPRGRPEDPGRLRRPPGSGPLRGVRVARHPDPRNPDPLRPADRRTQPPPEGGIPDRARAAEETPALLAPSGGREEGIMESVVRARPRVRVGFPRKPRASGRRDGTFLFMDSTIPSSAGRVREMSFVRPRYLAIAFSAFFGIVAYLAWSVAHASKGPWFEPDVSRTVYQTSMVGGVLVLIGLFVTASS